MSCQGGIFFLPFSPFKNPLLAYTLKKARHDIFRLPRRALKFEVLANGCNVGKVSKNSSTDFTKQLLVASFLMSAGKELLFARALPRSQKAEVSSLHSTFPCCKHLMRFHRFLPGKLSCSTPIKFTPCLPRPFKRQHQLRAVGQGQ